MVTAINIVRMPNGRGMEKIVKSRAELEVRRPDSDCRQTSDFNKTESVAGLNPMLRVSGLLCPCPAQPEPEIQERSIKCTSMYAWLNHRAFHTFVHNSIMLIPIYLCLGLK